MFALLFIYYTFSLSSLSTPPPPPPPPDPHIEILSDFGDTKHKVLEWEKIKKEM